jgi:hypothetical protein
MTLLKTLFSICIGFVITSKEAKAHTYWITTEGSHKINDPVQVRIWFGEYITGELMSGKSLDKIKDIRMMVRFAGQSDMPLIMTQDTGYWKGSFIPAKEGSYEIIGINDTREVQDWTKHGFGIVRPVQYLKHIYRVGTVETAQSSGSFLDIIMQNKDSQQQLQLFKNGKPATNTKFFISRPDGEEVPVETDEKGIARFETPIPGLYIIGFEWVDKTAGRFLGKEYTGTRYRLDASFYN